MERRTYPKSFNTLVRYVPAYVYLFVYVVTCLAGATVFYLDYKPVVALVEYFSGANIPKNYSLQEAMVLWALLLVAPLLFTFGFFTSKKIHISANLPLLQKIAGNSDNAVSPWVPMLFFVTAASFGIYDLIRAGAFSKLTAWVDYGEWVKSRWALFSTLGYFNFVNLYLILPVSAAWTMLSIQGKGCASLAKRFIPLTIVVFFDLLLFQKKALIVSLIIIFGAVILHRVFTKNWKALDTLFSVAAVAFIFAVYFVLVIIPVYSETSKTASQALVEKQVEEQEEQAVVRDKKKLVRTVVSIIGWKREVHIFVYALLSPFTRTSLPAMHYPLVFPRQHDYYGLDFGQDIVGFGEMPNDNKVIWENMYPNLPGAAAAPYQFVLYSQVGVVWTLVLCFFVGTALGVIWKIILVNDINPVWRSLMGSTLILFSVYLAIDSIRNSLLVSYGLIWAWLFISLSSSFLSCLTRQKSLIRGASCDKLYNIWTPVSLKYWKLRYQRFRLKHY